VRRSSRGRGCLSPGLRRHSGGRPLGSRGGELETAGELNLNHDDPRESKPHCDLSDPSLRDVHGGEERKAEQRDRRHHRYSGVPKDRHLARVAVGRKQTDKWQRSEGRHRHSEENRPVPKNDPRFSGLWDRPLIEIRCHGADPSGRCIDTSGGVSPRAGGRGDPAAPGRTRRR
jgi:hypothetical protein